MGGVPWQVNLIPAAVLFFFFCHAISPYKHCNTLRAAGAADSRAREQSWVPRRALEAPATVGKKI